MPSGVSTRAVTRANRGALSRVATEQVFATWIDAATTRLAGAGIARDEARRLATAIVAALEGGFVLARAQRDANALRETGMVMRRVVEDALAGVSSH